MIVVHCIEKLTICIRFYLRTTVPSGWRSHSSNAYMYGSVVLPTLPNPCELIADAFGLPADLRRYSVGASSLINDARESFSEKKNKSKKKRQILSVNYDPKRRIHVIKFFKNDDWNESFTSNYWKWALLMLRKSIRW